MGCGPAKFGRVEASERASRGRRDHHTSNISIDHAPPPHPPQQQQQLSVHPTADHRGHPSTETVARGENITAGKTSAPQRSTSTAVSSATQNDRSVKVVDRQHAQHNQQQHQTQQLLQQQHPKAFGESQGQRKDVAQRLSTVSLERGNDSNRLDATSTSTTGQVHGGPKKDDNSTTSSASERNADNIQENGANETTMKMGGLSNRVVLPPADRSGLRKTQSRLTASQIDFFRMVDEKIASGRDYESSTDGR